MLHFTLLRSVEWTSLLDGLLGVHPGIVLWAQSSTTFPFCSLTEEWWTGWIWLPWQPQSLWPLWPLWPSSVQFFVLCHSLLQLAQLLVSGYMKSSISTIERRYGLSSQKSGVLAAFNEVGRSGEQGSGSLTRIHLYCHTVGFMSR